MEKALASGKSYIVVGSPDVSDYAEVVLAKAYGISPYEPLPCNLPQCKGSECSRPCIGRCGYVFYKLKYFRKTASDLSPHPRLKSFCYREAQSKIKQFVLWYGKPFFCATDVTYGVISILKNPFVAENMQPSTVVVLSGFTGVATYGLAVLLGGKNDEDKESASISESDNAAKRLQDLLEKHNNEESLQILVKVRVDLPQKQAARDVREFRSVEIEDVQPLHRLASARAGS